MIIASYLETWIHDFYSLRLSQILKMYYSHEGVTFNTNVKACDRAQTFLYAVPKTILNEQVRYSCNYNYKKRYIILTWKYLIYNRLMQ